MNEKELDAFCRKVMDLGPEELLNALEERFLGQGEILPGTVALLEKLFEGRLSSTKTLGLTLQENRLHIFGYQILEKISMGNMGRVYKVRDPHLERVLILKTFRFKGQNPEAQQERFLQEAKIQSQLVHEHIARLYDCRQESNSKQWFILMEFIEGRTLDEVAGKTGPKLIQSIIKQTCAAVEEIHRLGYVHGDLKPQNIMLDHQDRIKILDLGLAKHLAVVPGATGCTPAFAPLEQRTGPQFGARADIYALGVTFYQILSGALPPIRDGGYHPALYDSELNRIFARAMEPNERHRYANVGLFRRELLEGLKRSPTAEIPKGVCEYEQLLMVQIEELEQRILETVEEQKDVTSARSRHQNEGYIRRMRRTLKDFQSKLVKERERKRLS